MAVYYEKFPIYVEMNYPKKLYLRTLDKQICKALWNMPKDTLLRTEVAVVKTS